MRNALGQTLDVGSAVVIVTQGRGWADIEIGKIEKFSSQGKPQVRYIGGRMSPPLIKTNRIYVIPEEQYQHHVQVAEILETSEKEFDAQYPEIEREQFTREVTRQSGTYAYTSWDWIDDEARKEYRRQVDERSKHRKDYVNAAMRAAGKEDYYE